MKRKIDIALDAEKELLFRIIENPKELDKLPRKGVLLPKQRVIIPFKSEKSIGRFQILGPRPSKAIPRKRT